MFEGFGLVFFLATSVFEVVLEELFDIDSELNKKREDYKVQCTGNDYSSIIKKSFTNIDSIATWGGEDQEIPDYGRIYIAIKPLLAELLTEDEKSEIKETVLKGKNVVSVTPIIVDPVFTRFRKGTLPESDQEKNIKMNEIV